VAADARIENLLSLALDEHSENPPGHRFAAKSLSRLFSTLATGMGVYELERGEACWPYHFEATEEEWLIVIDGELTLRTPEGEAVLRTGDVACFPAGAAGAHAVCNHTDARARFAMPSTRPRYGGASVYPDSGKLSVWSPDFHHRGMLGDPVDYWDGEK
jgi:uncharacterized cupin superfamily protein